MPRRLQDHRCPRDRSRVPGRLRSQVVVRGLVGQPGSPLGESSARPVPYTYRRTGLSCRDSGPLVELAGPRRRHAGCHPPSPPTRTTPRRRTTLTPPPRRRRTHPRIRDPDPRLNPRHSPRHLPRRPRHPSADALDLLRSWVATTNTPAEREHSTPSASAQRQAGPRARL
jgi:hypothetical protein